MASMRWQDKRVGLVNFGVWRFEIFDGLDGGWKLVLHPPLGCNLKPEAMTTNHVNGLAQLLEQARKQVSTLEVAN
jgi:hypothetical protein